MIQYRRTLFAASIVAAASALLFVDVLVGRGVFYIRDLALYHFPLKSVARQIVSRGEFPFWNHWINAGQPLAANPVHQTFYPLNWLILLPDFVYWFQILALIHIPIAALTTFALLRSMRLSRTAAVVGGLSFSLGGIMLSSLHLFPLLFTAAWMPLTLLFARRYLLERSPRDLSFAAAALAVQLLVGEPVTVLQTAILLVMYAVARAFDERRGAYRFVSNVAAAGIIGLAGLLLSSVQTVPAIDHTRDTVRARGLEFAVVSQWSTPPVRLAELLNPDLLGSRLVDAEDPSWSDAVYRDMGLPLYVNIYSGILVVLLAMAGLIARSRGATLYAAVVFTSAILAFGSHTPLLRLLYDAGLFRSIRYPEKFLLMGVFATVVFGSVVLDRIIAGDSRLRRAAIIISATAALAAAAIAAVFLGSHAQEAFRAMWDVASETISPEVLAKASSDWFAVALRASGVVLLMAAVGSIRRSLLIGVIGIFVIADLGAETTHTAPRTTPEFYRVPPPAAVELPHNRSEYRIFLISDWTTSMLHRRDYLVREHRFWLERNALASYAHAAYDIRAAIESDFDMTALRTSGDFAGSVWDLSKKTPEWLNYAAAMSNVRYVGMYRPFEEAVVAVAGDARRVQPIRWVGGALPPRYYFAAEVVPIASREDFVAKVASGTYARDAAFVEGSSAFAVAPARVVRWAEEANRIRIDAAAAGPAFLVMSVTRHKYWTISIDGREVPAIPTNIGYQGVVVPAGTHRIEMRYHNPLIAAGAGVSFATLVALVLFARRRNHPDAARDEVLPDVQSRR